MIEFRKDHLKKLIPNSKNNIEINIKDEIEINSLKALAIANNPKNKIEISVPTLSFQLLIDKVNAILKKEPIKSEGNDLLSDNQDLYVWVKGGLGLYNTTHKDLKECAFCGAPLLDGYVAKLNAFYSNEASKVLNEINALNKEIEIEIDAFKKASVFTISENDFEEDIAQSYMEKNKDSIEIKKKYRSFLLLLKNKLLEKNNNIFSPLEEILLENFNIVEIQNHLDGLKSLIDKHNSNIDSFKDRQSNARNAIPLHYVSKFLIEEKYYEKKYYEKITQQLNKRCDIIKLHYEAENKRLNQSLKSIAEGKKVLEEYIKKFLSRNDVSIELFGDHEFILNRNGLPAKNLSEGEKTAIAFSYFLVELESLFREDKLKDTIVFIDDPISSLDANHIAQVSYLINTFFFRNIDPENVNKIINCFKQLFISTHNFEFFSFIKDATNIRRLKKNPNYNANDKKSKKEVKACGFYMIKRKSKSEFINMPKYLKNYKSEYVYLFSEIITFNDNDDKNKDNIYIIPNVIRRFLEIYTLIKLPGDTSEIDSRIHKLWGNNFDELKILHNFSHFTRLERTCQHSELILKTTEIIDDIILLLKKDVVHYNSLCDGCSREDKKIS